MHLLSTVGYHSYGVMIFNWLYMKCRDGNGCLVMVYPTCVFPVRIMVGRLGYQWVRLPLFKKNLRFVFKVCFSFRISI